MKNYIYIILFAFSFFSCQNYSEFGIGVSQDTIDSVEVADSLLVIPSMKLSKDSVCVCFSFIDAKASRIESCLPVNLILSDGISSYMMNHPGRYDTTLPLMDMCLVVSSDTFFYSLAEYAGDTLKETITLDVFQVKGRIMEEDGTPLKQMPVHIHPKYKPKTYKIRKKNREIDNFDNDVLTYTDSLGYYKAYVPHDVFSLTLRSCGFLVGTISKLELIKYPTQNFLYMPVSIQNICGETVPDYVCSVTVKDMGITTSMSDWNDFFKHDDLLESVNDVILTAKYGKSTMSRRIKKRNAVFRGAAFTICKHY
jgi:hypothetical protein